MRHDVRRKNPAQSHCSGRDAGARQPSLLRALRRQQSHDALVRALPSKARRDLSAISGSRRALGARARKASETSPHCCEWISERFLRCSSVSRARDLITRQRPPSDERRVLVDLTPKGVSLRKRTEQMLGEFYCFLNMPLDELMDLKGSASSFRKVGRTERVAGSSSQNSQAGFLSSSTLGCVTGRGREGVHRRDKHLHNNME